MPGRKGYFCYDMARSISNIVTMLAAVFLEVTSYIGYE